MTDSTDEKKNYVGLRWAFTLCNPTERDNEELEILVSVAKNVIVAYEVGKDGMEHYQGYFELYKPQRLSFNKKILSRAHFTKAIKPAIANIRYCQKDGNVLFNNFNIDSEEIEESSEKKTARETVATEVIQMISSGSNMRSVFLAHPVFYMYNREKIFKVKKDLEFWKTYPNHDPEV